MQIDLPRGGVRAPASGVADELEQAGHTIAAEDVRFGRFTTFVCQVEGCGTLTSIGMPNVATEVTSSTLNLRAKCTSLQT